MLQFDLASPRLQAHPGDRGGGGGEHGLEAGIAMNSMLTRGLPAVAHSVKVAEAWGILRLNAE